MKTSKSEQPLDNADEKVGKKENVTEDTIMLLQKQLDDIKSSLPEDEIVKIGSKKSVKKDNLSKLNDDDIELPKKKKGISQLDSDIDLSKTIAINVTDGLEDDELSLIDEIDKQIDSMNAEAEIVNSDLKSDTDIDNIVQIKEKKIEKDDLRKRKNIFFLTGCLVFVVFIIMFSLFVFSNIETEQVTVDYVEEIAVAMNNYYETENIDDIVFILEDIKNDNELTKNIQEKVRVICDSWIILYTSEEVENKEAFESATNKYKGLIEGLYQYAIVKNDTNLVRALTENDYDELVFQIDNIYTDSVIFYGALDYYKQKDYNKSYYMLDRIEKDNSYYEKSITYKNKIVDNIIALINIDINKLEQGIQDLDDSEKLKVYTSIEQIVIDYNNVYYNVNLDENIDYQELLSKYTSKVSEYTDKVVGKVV